MCEAIRLHEMCLSVDPAMTQEPSDYERKGSLNVSVMALLLENLHGQSARCCLGGGPLGDTCLIRLSTSPVRFTLARFPIDRV
jgi:hypothetical protein